MHREAGETERGAVLALLAVVLFVFMAVAALAVDLSALERRGQTLQNTADAAALAAVTTWGETRDVAITQAKVDDLVHQNGLVGDDINVEVVASANEVKVSITDTDPQVFLSGFFSDGQKLQRDASARLDVCDDSCALAIDLPEPYAPTTTVADGDAYTPVVVGNRIYGIENGGDSIACIDRDTNEPCWIDQPALPYSGPIAGSLAHLVVVDTRLFWTAQEDHQLTLFCWQTLTESPCAATPLTKLERADGLEADWQHRGGGAIAVGSRVFVFSDDHRVHCVDAEQTTICEGYEGGRQSGLGTAGFSPLEPELGVSGSNIDRVLNDVTGRIYHTLQVQKTGEGLFDYRPGIFLDCWDTGSDAPCSGFTPTLLHSVAKGESGRLFLHRDAGGRPNGVCSTGLGTIQCVALDGSAAPLLVDGLAPLAAALPDETEYNDGQGVHIWHEDTNRLILTSPAQVSTIHCWDFSTASYCGRIYGFAEGIETADRGFVVEGECLFGIGAASTYWAFTVDMTTGCPGVTAETVLEACGCGGVFQWGDIGFNVDMSAGGPFDVLNVQVWSEDGELLLPANGDEWIEMVGWGSNVIDLSGLDGLHDRIKVRVYIETTSESLWETGDPPALLVGHRSLPYLVE